MEYQQWKVTHTLVLLDIVIDLAQNQKFWSKATLG